MGLLFVVVYLIWGIKTTEKISTYLLLTYRVLLLALIVYTIYHCLSHYTASPNNSSSARLAIGPGRKEVSQESSTLGKSDREELTHAKLYQELKGKLKRNNLV